MLYAKVVLGLAVSGPFDYSLPLEFKDKVKPGARVWVNFCNRKIIGYVTGLSRKSSIPKVKPVMALVDNYPLIDEKSLNLAKEISEYYCCSLGEVIETMLPEPFRKGRKAEFMAPKADQISSEFNLSVIQGPAFSDRFEIYRNEIKKILGSNRSVILVLPDIDSSRKAEELFNGLGQARSVVLCRKQKDEVSDWLKIKQGEFNLVIGTRSAVFAPLNNLGLIIIDEEDSFVYKQDQVPHYHAREAALFRASKEKFNLILGGSSISLESILLTKNGKAKYISLPTQSVLEIKISDLKRLPYRDRLKGLVFSSLLTDSILSALNFKKKILLFLNRKGFATTAACHNCGVVLKCPRCNINLVFHFKEDSLSCHYCKYKAEPPKICPSCSSGYIKYSGLGTEKIESEISRIFPQAKVKNISSNEPFNINDADIFIATSSIVRQHEVKFDLVGVLGIDNALSYIDFRASERVFALLVALTGIVKEKLIIQTRIAQHYIFEALRNKDYMFFYREELKNRKQLGFPPYRHWIYVKLRASNEEKVKNSAHALFDKLNSAIKERDIEILTVNPMQHAKLRGNFYWRILISCRDVLKANVLLRKHLKDFRHSGIIVTVDVDPI